MTDEEFAQRVVLLLVEYDHTLCGDPVENYTLLEWVCEKYGVELPDCPCTRFMNRASRSTNTKGTT